MPFITYPQNNGSVAIVTPVTTTMSIEEIAAKDVPAGVPYKIVDSLDIDRSFFNAYEFDADAGAVLNMDKAKAIRLDQFREARKPLLEALDVDYMRALEVEDSVAAAAIAVRKQELRDVTKLPLPDSLDELKAFLPSALNP
jgi:hypothetical protein